MEYMRRAIELSKLGKGYTNPNPLVGAVIVKRNKIIGEGYHKKCGEAHAEINALKSVKEDVWGATMYVTLEPCSHYGKTPPCTDSIIKSGITKVVVGMKDPNPLVSGKGINKLKDNGIEVETGILQSEIEKINEIFIKYITRKTPFCIMKTAMTLDGKIATNIGDSKWISNKKSRKYVHLLRHEISAIMVGIGTILADNPSLTTRLETKDGLDPIRVIVDTYARIPFDSKVLNLNSKAKTIIATTKLADEDKLKDLRKKGVEIMLIPLLDGKLNLKKLMQKLGGSGIDSILLEGGSTLNYSAINEGIVDKVISFISPKIIGGEKAKTPVGGDGRKLISNAINLKNISISKFDDDVMIEAYIRKEDNKCLQD